ncbi:MAG: hypothetical protein GY730_01075 [bacterium]|nr:hypothetical protein [bacterium]
MKFKRTIKDFTNVILDDNNLDAFRKGVLTGFINISNQAENGSIMQLVNGNINALQSIQGANNEELITHMQIMCNCFVKLSKTIKASIAGTN